jgi:hypothetical protein
VHVALFDASAHTPHGASMVIDGFKALRPPEVGSNTAMVARSAIRGSCVREWLWIWMCSGEGVSFIKCVCVCGS